MGIDGIGGARPPTGPSGGATTQELGGVREGGDAAEIEGVAEVGASPAEEPPEAIGHVERARLERGELSVEDYLELEVQRATAHLVELAPTAVLERVRAELRTQLLSDPVLRSLAEQVTSKAP